MTLKEALTRLHCREDWDEVLDYLAKEREPPSWIFNIPTSPTTRTSWPNWPEKLRPSTGCCESCRMIEPCEQFANEVTACLRRWSEESDLEEVQLAEIACEAINEWMDEDVVGFEADDGLLDDSGE